MTQTEREKQIAIAFSNFVQFLPGELKNYPAWDEFLQSAEYKAISEAGERPPRMMIRCKKLELCHNYAKKCHLCERNLDISVNLIDWYSNYPPKP